MQPEFLFITRWTPDEAGGGTQQRAAANLRALASCGRVHVLNLGSDTAAIPRSIEHLVASVTGLDALHRKFGRPFRFEARQSLADRVLHTAWGMSGLIAVPSASETAAIMACLPTVQFQGLFAFHLGSACIADAFDQRIGRRIRRIIDWDFLESPNVMPWARSMGAGSGVVAKLSAKFNQHKIERWESRILHSWDCHLCSSALDVPFLQSGARAGASVSAVNNGADVPQHCPPPPPVAGAPTLIFVGTMAYLPNLAGIEHFLQWIWPHVRARIPGARLQIVGRAPPASLLRRSGQDGVEVHANVASVEPFYLQSHVAIAPMQFAVGSNLKVPEAMSFGRPLVGYRAACDRHGFKAGEGVLAVDAPGEFAQALVRLLQAPENTALLGQTAHRVAYERVSRQAIDAQLGHAIRQATGLLP